MITWQKRCAVVQGLIKILDFRTQLRCELTHVSFTFARKKDVAKCIAFRRPKLLLIIGVIIANVLVTQAFWRTAQKQPFLCQLNQSALDHLVTQMHAHREGGLNLFGVSLFSMKPQKLDVPQ